MNALYPASKLPDNAFLASIKPVMVARGIRHSVNVDRIIDVLVSLPYPLQRRMGMYVTQTLQSGRNRTSS
jgi:hypothetical protein